MAILGLVSSESYSSQRYTNIRRSVQYYYPGGGAPLLGLLSLMDGEGEETDDPKYSHWEKVMGESRDTTASQGSSKGPFMTSGGSDAGDPFSWTADTSYRVFTTLDHTGANAKFRVGHVVQITADNTTPVEKKLVGVITSVAATYIVVRATNTEANIKNGTTTENVGEEILVIGSAFAQGVVDLSTQIHTLPVNIENYTQIFRTPFSFTGTALKTGLKFDETGPYRDKAKEHSINHMKEIEFAFLFGQKYLSYSAATPDPTTGTGLPTYTTGGILYHLQRWEAGDYGTVTASADTDDDKRIIVNSGGTINEKTYDGYLERVFRMTNNTANEKLVLCGSGFLSVINQLYKSKSVLDATFPKSDAYGMSVVRHVTPFGDIYYKTHPLFSQNSALRFNALILDVKNLKYRYMIGRDTELLKNRQPNDADYRKDEYLTECGLECWFPQSHMYLQNVRAYEP